MKHWVLATRPATLTAAAVPVAVGTACAWRLTEVRWLPTLAALLGAFLIQIGTNFANDVFDAERGADGPDRLGPARAVSEGWISPAAMKRAMWLTFALACLPGAYLASVAGWPIFVIGLASIASGIAYTGGPYPLGYNGLGDLFVMIFFGFVGVGGTAYVHLQEVPTIALWASLPVGALSTAILVVNNVRDRETDMRTGKRTLAVLFGRPAALAQYALLMACSFAVPIGLWLDGSASRWVLLPLITGPFALILMSQLVRRRGAALNRTLAATAMLLLLFGGLFSAGLATA